MLITAFLAVIISMASFSFATALHSAPREINYCFNASRLRSFSTIMRISGSKIPFRLLLSSSVNSETGYGYY